jgi:hypothetical protein
MVEGKLDTGSYYRLVQFRVVPADTERNLIIPPGYDATADSSYFDVLLGWEDGEGVHALEHRVATMRTPPSR